MKSSLSNIKQKCCGSCKYYAGVRDYKRGFFFGSSFEVDQKGIKEIIEMDPRFILGVARITKELVMLLLI